MMAISERGGWSIAKLGSPTITLSEYAKNTL